MDTTERYRRINAELTRYEHPLFEFAAALKGEGVEVSIRFRSVSPAVHTYTFEVHPRDIEHSQFTWNFQRQLYNCLHDYVIEMFTRNPQYRGERREGGQ